MFLIVLKDTKIVPVHKRFLKTCTPARAVGETLLQLCMNRRALEVHAII